MSDIAERFAAWIDKQISDYREQGLTLDDAITELKGLIDGLEQELKDE